MTTFAQLGLPDPLVRTLSGAGLTESFPIQAAVIPDALAGRDISGQAPTGSGKTLAFGLPLLVRVGRAKPGRPRALILAPTRELAEQIRAELAPLATSMARQVTAIYGGVAYGPQKNALRRGVDVLVATPGRLEDLIAQGTLALDEVEIVVIDEADRMADMGFLPAVRRIVGATCQQRQTMMFSATLDSEAAALSHQYQRNAVLHEVAAIGAQAGQVQHVFWRVDEQDRVQHVAGLIERNGRALAFTRTRRRADRLAKQLSLLGISTVALHGGRTQAQRTKALAAFASGRVQAMVATDVAARGIHIEAVAMVIQVDLAADAKSYLHRAGRTARAGADGTVVSLIAGSEEREVLRMQKQLQMRTPIVAPTRELPVRKGSSSSARTEVETKGVAPQAQTVEEQSLYVSNLSWEVTAHELGELFSQYGKVNQTTIVTHRNGRSRGFGFVNMHALAAPMAIDGLHGAHLNGRPLTVRPARQVA
ncbi:MAG: DEAD/DEAH box helicase [Acidimicrobiia bacterium]